MFSTEEKLEHAHWAASKQALAIMVLWAHGWPGVDRYLLERQASADASDAC